MNKGTIGTSMGGSVISPKAAARRARFRARQDAAWSAKSGDVTITYKSQTPEQIETNQKGLAEAKAI